MTVNLVLFIFLFEETKFSIHTIAGSEVRAQTSAQDIGTINTGDISKRTELVDPEGQFTATTNPTTGPHETQDWVDHSIPLKSPRQRLALFTTSAGTVGQFLQHIYMPVKVLVSIPAVAYVMVQYCSSLIWFTVVATTQSEYLALPPYNFGTTGIGLLNLPPFIGSIFGCIWGGPVSDWSIKFLARRNEGIYEPEMRLYISLLPGILGPVGLFLYGYSVSEVITPTSSVLPRSQPKIPIGVNCFCTGLAVDFPLSWIWALWIQHVRTHSNRPDLPH